MQSQLIILVCWAEWRIRNEHSFKLEFQYKAHGNLTHLMHNAKAVFTFIQRYLRDEPLDVRQNPIRVKCISLGSSCINSALLHLIIPNIYSLMTYWLLINIFSFSYVGNRWCLPIIAIIALIVVIVYLLNHSQSGQLYISNLFQVSYLMQTIDIIEIAVIWVE